MGGRGAVVRHHELPFASGGAPGFARSDCFRGGADAAPTLNVGLVQADGWGQGGVDSESTAEGEESVTAGESTGQGTLVPSRLLLTRREYVVRGRTGCPGGPRVPRRGGRCSRR